jgi:hypothetical protein
MGNYQVTVLANGRKHYCGVFMSFHAAIDAHNRRAESLNAKPHILDFGPYYDILLSVNSGWIASVTFEDGIRRYIDTFLYGYDAARAIDIAYQRHFHKKHIDAALGLLKLSQHVANVRGE